MAHACPGEGQEKRETKAIRWTRSDRSEIERLVWKWEARDTIDVVRARRGPVLLDDDDDDEYLFLYFAGDFLFCSVFFSLVTILREWPLGS